jgi:exosortase A-associated hydrolase 2
MNKSRRQTTLVATALARNGIGSITLDLYGTGDSEGEFAHASWNTWKSDVATVLEWATKNSQKVDSILATRLGCMLAAATLREYGIQMLGCVFWQPVESGRIYMNQFLRTRVAASMMADSQPETVDLLREKLKSGSIVDIAGYSLPHTLWAAIDSLSLCEILTKYLGKLQIIEIGRTSDAELSSVGRKIVATANANDIHVSGSRVAGEPFWATSEIVVNEALVRMTVNHLTQISQN